MSLFLFSFFNLLRVLCFIVPLLVSVAYLTLIERKLIASIQRRKGPNVVGWFGLLQPFADLVKLIVKETILPTVSNKYIFMLSPVLSLFFAFLGWVFIPVSLGYCYADLNLGMLYVFSTSSLGVYGIVLSGWSSNSRYAFLGGLRSAAQVISYEVSIALTFISIFLSVGSLSLTAVSIFQATFLFSFAFPIIFFIFLISGFAETNRPPFDLPEAEAELVAGYFVEYSSMTFALFFVAEYSNILLFSSLSVLLFFGGWGLGIFIFASKLLFFIFIFVWVRAAFPRYRYDQLMRLGWRVFLPVSFGYVAMTLTLLAVVI